MQGTDLKHKGQSHISENALMIVLMIVPFNNVVSHKMILKPLGINGCNI